MYLCEQGVFFISKFRNEVIIMSKKVFIGVGHVGTDSYASKYLTVPFK